MQTHIHYVVTDFLFYKAAVQSECQVGTPDKNDPGTGSRLQQPVFVLYRSQVIVAVDGSEPNNGNAGKHDGRNQYK
jgi:hypothetical protein